MKKNNLIILVGLTLIILGVGLMVQLKYHNYFRILRLGSNKIYSIRIGCSALTPIHCLFGEVLKHTDILKKHGLRGEIVFFIHGNNQSAACKAKKIDATFSCEIPAIFQLVACPDSRLVGTPGSLGRIALIVPRQSAIFSLQDLKGKTILIHEGASATMMTRKWLQGCGLNPDRDVKLIYSDKDNILNRTSGEEAVAIVAWDPWLDELLKKQEFRVIKERLFRSAIVMMEGYLRKYPEAVVRYEAALKDAFQWASNNKEAVIRWISARSGIEQKIIKDVLELNENWVLSERQTRAVNLSLKQEDVKILKECNDYLINTGQIPLDFDISKKINSEVFNK